MKTCFFCARPEPERVLYESEHFYVLLSLGPIVEGTALLVAKEHFRSMFDLPPNLSATYTAEKARLKQLINTVYGPCIITEHGRVQACLVEDEEAHDLLCYHAHQIFFPVSADLSNLFQEGPFEPVFQGHSLFDLPALAEEDEYLLFEDTSNRVFVNKVLGKCPRQYMRYLVARSVDRPELTSWARFPEHDRIFAAKEKYLAALRCPILAFS